MERKSSITGRWSDKVRGFFADRGQESSPREKLIEVTPMIGYKADWRDRLDKIEERRRERDEERGRPVAHLTSTSRSVRRIQARRDKARRLKMNRNFKRQVQAKRAINVTAQNMARAAAGEFNDRHPGIQRNVLAVVAREEAKQS